MTLRDRLGQMALEARKSGRPTVADFEASPDAHPAELEALARIVETARAAFSSPEMRPRLMVHWLMSLAAELMDGGSPEAWSFAARAIELTGKTAGTEWTMTLARKFAGELEAFFSGLAGPDGDEVDTLQAKALEADDGMWWLSARLAGHIEQMADRAALQGRDGTYWTDTARDIRDRNRARWSARETNPMGPWEWWLDSEEVSRALQVFSVAVWRLELADEHDRVLNAVKARPAVVLVGPDQYVKIGKGLTPASWAMGAPGIEVEVDGDRYAATSGVVRYVSRAMGIRPDKDGRPSGVQLPLDLQVDAVPVTVAAVRDAQFVIGPKAAKQLLFMFATARRNGLVELSVEDMTRQVNPTLPRYQKRDHEQTLDAALSLRRTCLVFPDGYNAQIMEIHYAPEPGGGIGALQWGFTHGFTKRLEAETRLQGEFVLNLSGAMRLTARQSPELRAYVFAAGQWNDAKRPGTDIFDPAYLPAYDVEQWGAMTNTLSEAAVEYLQEGAAAKRRKLSASKNDVHRWLEALQDEHGLVRIEQHGKRFKVLPPEALLEAYRLHRTGVRRPSNE